MYAVGAHVVHSVSMFDCPTKSDVLAKIANLHASTPGNDLLAFQGFNHSIQSPDRTFIMRDELDEISKERPIMITHNTGGLEWPRARKGGG